MVCELHLDLVKVQKRVAHIECRLVSEGVRTISEALCATRAQQPSGLLCYAAMRSGAYASRARDLHYFYSFAYTLGGHFQRPRE